MKVASIVGARPQFVKAVVVSAELRKVAQEVLVHTGQHYDYSMSGVFFDQLGLPSPDYHLGVGSGTHGVQTGQMLGKIEEVLLAEQPNWVVVYGDTNSTLAGALAATKIGMPVAHVEAGLRSFNRTMPEEVNRIVTDHVSTCLFCPTQTAVGNLAREGITHGVHEVGDVMLDAMLSVRPSADEVAETLRKHGVTPGRYLLVTIHRAANTDDLDILGRLISTLGELQEDILFPVHPRTRKVLAELRLEIDPHVRLVEPVGYREMIVLQEHARMILTDSGGIQKEAYVLRVPCVTLREETEWVETVDVGWNILVGSDRQRILEAVAHFVPNGVHPPLFGDGTAAHRIATILGEVR